MLPGARHSIPILLWLVLGAALGAALGAVAAAGARAQVSPAPAPPDVLPLAPLPPGLVVAETERVVEIVDGDTLVLAGGRQVRLVGIQVTTRFVAFHLSSSTSLEARMKPCI